jgi:hypothetical protein
MANRPSRRTKNSRMVVRLPERSLSRSVLHVAAPLLEQLGSQPPADEVRRAVALSIDVWNAHVSASRLWGRPKTKPLAELRRAMRRETTVSGRRGIFELLARRPTSLTPSSTIAESPPRTAMTTIYTRAATVLELFAQDVLKPVGKGAVSLVLSGKMLGSMVLSEVRIGGDGARGKRP